MKNNRTRIKNKIKSVAKWIRTKSFVTVVVPVYNGEDTIAKCLDYLFGQTQKKIKIICVNDGSTDGTLRILRRYKRKHWGMKIIDQNNGGRSAARNSGLRLVKTKYVMFCDDDDYFELGMCEKMVDVMNRSNADAAACGIKVFYNVHDEMIESDDEYYKIKFDGMTKVDDEVILKTDASVCSKIFRMDIIRKHNIVFPVRLNNEDFYFWNAYVSVSNNIYYLRENLYNYIRHEGSIMSENFEAKNLSMDHLLVANKLFDFYKKTGFLVDHLNLFWRQWIASFWFSYRYTASEYHWKVKEKARKFLEKNYKEYEPSDKELQQWKKDIDDTLKKIKGGKNG